MKSMLRLLTFAAIFVGSVGSVYAQTGTAQTATQLNTEIGSTLATGSQITALQLRQVLVDVVASSGLVLGNPTAFTNGISAAGGAFAVSSSGNVTAVKVASTFSATAPTADSAVDVIQNGAKTASQIYAPVLPANYFFFDGVRSVVDLESGTTVQQGSAFGAYTYNNNAEGSNPNQKNAVGFFALGVTAIDGAFTWGINTACNDNTSNGSATLSGRHCIGYEADFQANGASTFQGISMILQGVGTPASANGVQVSIGSGSTAKWTNGFVIDNGAVLSTGAGVILGATATSGTNISSAPIYLNVFDSSANARRAQITGIPFGTASAIQFFDPTLGSLNGVTLVNAGAGGSAQVLATGSDSNIDLILAAKGTGVLRNSNSSFSVSAAGALTVASCTGCGVGGSGTVNSGTAQQLAWYAGTGTAVSGNANATVDSSGNITSANQEALLGTFSANNGANSLGMTNAITGTYTYYKIYLDNFVPATEDNFRLQLTTDNGGSYVTTSYVSTIVVNQNSATSLVGTATNGILLSGASSGASGTDVGATTGYGLSGVIYLFDPLSTSKAKYIHGETTWSAGSSAPGTTNLTNGRVYGYHNDTNTGYNGFRIATGGGANIVTGTMRVYGIK